MIFKIDDLDHEGDSDESYKSQMIQPSGSNDRNDVFHSLEPDSELYYRKMFTQLIQLPLVRDDVDCGYQDKHNQTEIKLKQIAEELRQICHDFNQRQISQSDRNKSSPLKNFLVRIYRFIVNTLNRFFK